MDSRSPRDGRVIEELGSFDPHEPDVEKQLRLNRERIDYWLSVGAQPSETVRNILDKNGFAVRPSRKRRPTVPTRQEREAAAKAEAAKAEAAKAEA